MPVVGTPAERAVEAFKAAVREFLQPPAFFEALGVRYVGPVDGHDIPALEHGLPQRRGAVRTTARSSSTSSPRRAAATRRPRTTTRSTSTTPRCSTRWSGRRRPCRPGTPRRSPRPSSRRPRPTPRIVAITAAMAGPTGLLPFQARFPDRFFDVGIAEQHAVTGAAGMAMGGLRPVVAIYSTFLNRAWDQVVYDVALHRLPVVFCLDRAGITGPTAPATTASTTWRCSPPVPGMRCSPRRAPQELHRCSTTRWPSPTAARRHPLPAGRRRRSASTTSASVRARGLRGADQPADGGVHPGDRQARRGRREGADHSPSRHRRHGLGRALLRPARRRHARRRRPPPAGGHRRGRRPRRGRHDDRRSHRRALSSSRSRCSACRPGSCPTTAA